MAGRELPGLKLKGFFGRGNNNWDEDMDANLRLLSAVTQLTVASISAALPGTAPDGTVTVNPADKKINVRDNGAWVALTPLTGWSAYVTDVAKTARFDGTNWVAAADVQPLNANLTSLASLVLAANDMLLATGAGTLAKLATTSYGRGLLALTNLANAQSTLGLVPVTSTTDTTAGRLLTVGYVGLGGAAVVVNGVAAAAAAFDVNNVPSGKYHLQLSGVSWRDLPAGEYAVEVTRLGGSGGCVQKATHYSTGVEYERRVVSQNFTKKVLLVGDILGTVSQSGGVPTGSIMERGSNALGEYVKFADGTLIQTGEASPTVDTLISNSYGTTSGNMYYFNQTITFPVPFVNAAYCLSAGVTVRGTIGTIGRTSASAGLVQVRMTGNGVNVPFSWVAIGRWF